MHRYVLFFTINCYCTVWKKINLESILMKHQYLCCHKLWHLFIYNVVKTSPFSLHTQPHCSPNDGPQSYNIGPTYIVSIGLCKMFSRWIWGIFNIQIQRDRGHKLMIFMVQNKDKDLLGIYQYGCDPFCVSLLTDRHLKVRSNSILFTFLDKGALTSARDS